METVIWSLSPSRGFCTTEIVTMPSIVSSGGLLVVVALLCVRSGGRHLLGCHHQSGHRPHRLELIHAMCARHGQRRHARTPTTTAPIINKKTASLLESRTRREETRRSHPHKRFFLLLYHYLDNSSKTLMPLSFVVAIDGCMAIKMRRKEK
jgi:hypothetical protein